LYVVYIPNPSPANPNPIPAAADPKLAPLAALPATSAPVLVVVAKFCPTSTAPAGAILPVNAPVPTDSVPTIGAAVIGAVGAAVVEVQVGE